MVVNSKNCFFIAPALLFALASGPGDIEMRDWLQNTAMKAIDRVMAGIPWAVPSQLALRNCKIISHRGEHDNISVIENTLPAGVRAQCVAVE